MSDEMRVESGATVHLIIRDRDVTGIGYAPDPDISQGRITLHACGSSVVLDVRTIVRASQIVAASVGDPEAEAHLDPRDVTAGTDHGV